MIPADMQQFTQETRMLDATDSRLLAEIQQNAMLTAQDLGERLNLSPSQAARRRQRLETEGYVTGYNARLNAGRIGLSLQAFVQVQLSGQTPQILNSFAELITQCPNIIAAWTMTGDADCVLRLACCDLPDLNRILHEVLLAHPSVKRVHSQIVLDQFKADAALPICPLPLPAQAAT